MKINFSRYKKKDAPKKAIIAIHGWGGNKSSFAPFIKNLKIDDVQWFLPEAPYIIEDDPEKRAWTYKKDNGVWEIDDPMRMMDSFFNDIVFKEYRSQNVYVIGFSQGASVCYEYVVGIKKTLGGIFPIGGFLFKDSIREKRVSKNNINTPILIGHGIKDDVIPIEKSKIAYNQLLEEGANVKFYKYNGGHKISMNYLREMLRIIDGSR